MGLPRSKNSVGLGNSLMNDRFGKKQSNMHRESAQQGITRVGEDGQRYITNHKKAAAYEKMRSVTEQGALDEFLSTAELAGTDFTAEKMNNVRIIHRDQKNPYLLSAQEERAVRSKQEKNRSRLTIPRRPKWDQGTTREELDQKERASFLEWRRGLAEMQETQDLLMTPFERNLEVWRQLWRVIERSDLVVQITDCRNPLLYRTEDLERYVKEVDKRKRNLLLLNKADMLTEAQRRAWAEYLTKAGIRFRFFSAELAKEANEAARDEDLQEGSVAARSEAENADERGGERDDEAHAAADTTEEEDDGQDDATGSADPDDDDDDDDDEGPALSIEEQTRILTTSDLEALFLAHAPARSRLPPPHLRKKISVGLVGQPNVGKSSSINALLGAKRVSVSNTPGKTKHFQTIHLNASIVLIDCPGLVFPNFAGTKADLVVNGVLPIDQLREWTGPLTLLARRVPRVRIERAYGIRIRVRPEEEGGTGIPTGEEVARALALARGFRAGGAAGAPDESRAARVLLKDLVRGKLLYCEPPPGWEGGDFNDRGEGEGSTDHLVVVEGYGGGGGGVIGGSGDNGVGDGGSSHVAPSEQEDVVSLLPGGGGVGGGGEAVPREGPRTKLLDRRFFAPGQGRGQMSMPFHHKYSEQGKEEQQQQQRGLAGGGGGGGGGVGGRTLSGRKERTMVALESDLDPDDVRVVAMTKGGGNGKKHFKGNKRALKKVRSDYD